MQHTTGAATGRQAKTSDHPGLTIRIRRVNAAGQVIEQRPPVTISGDPQPLMSAAWPPCQCGRCAGAARTAPRSA